MRHARAAAIPRLCLPPVGATIVAAVVVMLTVAVEAVVPLHGPPLSPTRCGNRNACWTRGGAQKPGKSRLTTLLSWLDAELLSVFFFHAETHLGTPSPNF